MEKRVIALRGISKTGKSTTIKLVYELLTAKYRNAKEQHGIFRTDIRVVLTINGVKIGIESQGDPNSRLEDSLKYFQKIGCSVIICATRIRGGTVDAVNNLRDSYKIIFIPKTKASHESEIESSNLEMAKKVVRMAEEIIGPKAGN